MSETRRRIRRVALWGLGLLLIAGAVAPFVQANRFGGRVQNALQNSLHRKVKIGPVHLNLFTGPGFTIEDVTIEEDPAFGVETFAQVKLLRARVSLSTLWTGKLHFSTLTLEEPSLNLVKPDTATWNILPLLQQAGYNSGDSGAAVDLPEIQVREGRIYFKFGDTKSAFYLTNTSLDIWPRSEAGTFSLRFTGEPARTDRMAQGFGTLNARGVWTASVNAESKLDLNVELERSAVAEMTQLIRGRDYGLHGLVASKATVKGPLSNLHVAGQLQIEDVHRWDLMPASRGGMWKLNYRGLIDWRGQKIEIAATPKDNPDSTIFGQFRLYSFLSQPRHASELTFAQVPVAAVTEVLRHVGASLPKEITSDGKVVGVIGYSSAGGLQGKASVEDGSIQVPGGPIHVKQAELEFSGNRVVLKPAELAGEHGQSAELEGSFQPEGRVLDVKLTAKALSFSESQTGSGRLFTAAETPLVERFDKGRWSGWLRYQASQDQPGVWTGAFDIRDAQTKIPGVVDPVRVSGTVALDGNRVSITRMHARAGAVDLDGDYRYEPGEARPHRFHLNTKELDLAECERLLLPTLRREQGFFARTLKLRPAPMPEWLAERRAEGTLRAASVVGGDLQLRDARARMVWNGGNVTLEGLEAKFEEGSVKGNLNVDLRAGGPQYLFKGQAQDFAWKSGRMDLEGDLETSGLGEDFLLGLRSKGMFQARSFSVVADNPVRVASGVYEFTMSRLGPKLSLSSLQASFGADRYLGQGATLADGRLQVELSSGSRVMHLTGSLAPLRLDMVPIKQ